MMSDCETRHPVSGGMTPAVEADIDNHTGMPHLWMEQAGAEGERLDILIVRGTFDFSRDGKVLSLARTQNPVVVGDSYAGVENDCVMRAVVAEDGDLVPYKPGTDILVVGTASAPGGLPHHHWLAKVQVGTVQKSIRLHGPRQLRKTMLGWKMSQAEPITRLALDYRLAYGGCLAVPPELTGASGEFVKHDDNPAGCGWLPKRRDYSHLPRKARRYVRRWIGAQSELKGPQIEDAAAPIRKPYGGKAHSLGAVARWWTPRVKLQGTFDEAWRAQRFPLLPKNFNSRYFQAAHHDLVATPHLNGDEPISLIGLLPERRDMRLPGWRILAVVKRASGESVVYLPLLDTVRFDLSTQQATLVWRANFEYGDDPVVEVVIGATDTEVARGVVDHAGEKAGRPT